MPLRLAKHVMNTDPLSGHLFAFINRRATRSAFGTSTVPSFAWGPVNGFAAVNVEPVTHQYWRCMKVTVALDEANPVVESL